MKPLWLLILSTTVAANSRDEFENSRLCSGDFCDCKADTVPYFVDCSGHQLNDGMFPDLPEELTGEEHIMIDLDFSDNQLNTIDPLPALPVHSLSYRHNTLSTIAPGAFKKLKFITYLDLSHNQLTVDDLDAKTFEGKGGKGDDYEALGLLELDLSYNKLTSIEQEAFTPLAHLEGLKLDGNPLGRIDSSTLKAISSLRELKRLSLVETAMFELPAEGLWLNLPNLFSLDLTSNNLKQFCVGSKSEIFDELQTLTLDDNNFKTFGQSDFTCTPNVHTLSLRHMTKLTRVDEAAFTPMRDMDTLYLAENAGLDFIHPDAFEGIHTEDFKLNTLDISNNHLSYLPHHLVPDIRNWSNFTSLDLRGNPWACDCHNEWVAWHLLKHIESRSPELVDGVVCAKPEGMKGKNMKALQEFHPKEIPCNQLDQFNPYKEHYGVVLIGSNRYSTSGGSALESDGEQEHSDKLAVGVAVVCLLTIMAAGCFVGGLYLQRQRQIRYRTFENVRFQASQRSEVGAGQPQQVPTSVVNESRTTIEQFAEG